MSLPRSYWVWPGCQNIFFSFHSQTCLWIHRRKNRLLHRFVSSLQLIQPTNPCAVRSGVCTFESRDPRRPVTAAVAPLSPVRLLCKNLGIEGNRLARTGQRGIAGHRSLAHRGSSQFASESAFQRPNKKKNRAWQALVGDASVSGMLQS